MQLNRSFNCSYSDLEKELSLDTDLEDKRSDQIKKNDNSTINDLIINLPDNLNTSTSPTTKTINKSEDKENQSSKTIEVTLKRNSNEIEQKLVNCNLSNLGGYSEKTNFMNSNNLKAFNNVHFREDCTDSEFDSYPSESDSEDDDENCSKCSLDKNQANFLNTKRILNYLDPNNNLTDNEFNSKFNNSASFVKNHPTNAIVIPRLKTEI